MSSAAEATTQLLTADDMLDRTGQGRWELVRGEVREMPPAGWEHGRCVLRLTLRLGNYVEAQGLGEVIGGETGFLISRHPDTVRAPDIAFIGRGKSPDQAPKGWAATVPDLVVEVVSPWDRVGEVEEKIADWLNFGVQLLWTAYPGTRTVHVHRPAQAVRVLGEGDTLEGEEVVPGFSLLVSEIFA
jgi:Uma2 family endonuclease